VKLNLASSVGVLALLGLLGVTIAEMQTADPQVDTAQTPDPQVAETQVAPDAQPAAPADAPERELPLSGESQILPAPSMAQVPPPPRPYRGAADHPGRGLYVRPDGTTVGRVTYIDRSSLLLVPIPNTVVSFLVDRKVVAQAVTDESGTFMVRGLTPWSVCSVVMSSPNWVCMYSMVIRPYDPATAQQRAAGSEPGVNAGWVNEIRLVSLVQAEDGAEGDGALAAELQAVPREDFIAALQNDLFGTNPAGGPAAAPMAPGGGYAGGGGGGGGAGGGGDGGLGGALIGAAAGAAIGAALGSGDSDGQPASPFQPPIP